MLTLNQLARMSTSSMLNGMLEGIAIGLFAWILLRVIGDRNSSTRFAVWFSALLAIAALPVIGIASSGSTRTGVGSITVPSSWASYLFILWAVIAGLALLRVGAGLLQLRKLRASCTAIDAAAVDPLLRTTLQEFQAVRPATLCHSAHLQVPAAIGFLKPIVVIPSWALQELSPTELHSILIHELAHLRRWDDWTNLAQQILKALLFFHPAVWWIQSQLALEREMACDDAVLAETGNPRGYAKCLVSMAEKSFLRRGLDLAQAVVSRMRQTSLRVSQILDTNRSPATRIWKPALYSVASFFVVCLVSASHAPELVAFQDRIPEVATASARSPQETLTSATGSDYFAKRPTATPASFRANSTALAAPQSSKYRLQERRSRSLAPENTAYRIRRSMNSPVRPNAAYRVSQRMNSPVLQVAEFRIWEGTSLFVPQSAANTSGLQPLRAQGFDEAGLAHEADFAPEANPQSSIRSGPGNFTEAGSTTIGQPILTQTTFVVMETQYDEPRPSVIITIWHVTILDSARVPSETRIPAKQI